VAATDPEPLSDAVPTAQEPEQQEPPPAVSVAQACAELFPEEPERALELLRACPTEARESVRCLIEARYAEDEQAQKLAVELWQRYETLVGVEKAYTAEVGWRGVIDFVPELPVGKYREHLVWTAAALEELDRVMTGLQEAASASSDEAAARFDYRWKGLRLRFFRSVERTTPSAYAQGWTVAYNVVGSLLKSESGVRETMVHEIFHLNDDAHGDWSIATLEELHESLIARCTPKGETAPKSSCLKPYAPGSTKVKGGTYYAFQPGNDVREYAAELAVRYFQEQRAALDGKTVKKPFKCGPEENAQAWSLFIDEFFAGVDLLPPCAP
jgi:hypothetical protein